MGKRRVPLLLAMLFLFVLLTSCSGGSAPSMSTERIQQLGEQFKQQLNDIYIPNRENNQLLLEQDAVLVIDDVTHHLSYLDDFYEDYKVGEDTELITVFKSKSFVVAKVVFEGDTGCYFRYEFNPLRENEIVISSQPLDRVEIVSDDTLNKVELTLQKEKETPIVFSFKNINEE